MEPSFLPRIRRRTVSTGLSVLLSLRILAALFAKIDECTVAEDTLPNLTPDVISDPAFGLERCSC